MFQYLCGLIASVIVAVARKDPLMAGRRHTPEQIIRKLAEGQKLLAGGMDVEGCAASSGSPSRPGRGGSTSTAG